MDGVSMNSSVVASHQCKLSSRPGSFAYQLSFSVKGTKIVHVEAKGDDRLARFNLTSKSKEVVMLTKEVLELSEEQLEQFKNCGTKKKILCQLKEALREVDLGTYGR